MSRRWTVAAAVALASAALIVVAQATIDSAPLRFSALQPGQAFSAGWHVLPLPDKPATRFSLVADGGTTVLRAESENAAATLVGRFRADPNQQLAWRWRVDRTVANADLHRKDADDFAARVYVFFDVPLDSLPLATRIKFRAVKLFYKVDLPTAALCYVWDNKHAVGHSAWSAYTDRVRIIVLRSGAPDKDGSAWREEVRNPAADFKTAFGFDAPAITGIALGSDTDQTGERVVALFGDVELKPAP